MTIADRRAGVLLGGAVADALGAGYEFSPPMAPEAPVAMIGGGPFGFAAGEWTDDTSMAVAVAEAVSRGGDPTDVAFLDRIVDRWFDWALGDPPDIGNQTRAVLFAADDRSSRGLGEAARRFFADHPDGSAGNGALMRTAPLALARLTERGMIVAAAAVAELTHADPVSSEACGIWTHACHHALVHANLDGVRTALHWLPQERAVFWRARLDEAEAQPPTAFPKNGWVVHALQAAWSAIVHTPVPDDDPPAHLRLALETAIRAGGDTDTVACIAGGLLGARWGASAIPQTWRAMLHGWPGYGADDLVRLSLPDPISEALSRPVRY